MCNNLQQCQNGSVTGVVFLTCFAFCSSVTKCNTITVAKNKAYRFSLLKTAGRA